MFHDFHIGQTYYILQIIEKIHRKLNRETILTSETNRKSKWAKIGKQLGTLIGKHNWKSIRQWAVNYYPQVVYCHAPSSLLVAYWETTGGRGGS